MPMQSIAKHVAMIFPVRISKTSRNGRIVRDWCLALLFIQLIAVMSPDFPAMADDKQKMLTPSDQLPNGHTVGELGSAIKAGFGLRDTFVQSGVPNQNPNKEKLEQFLSLPIPPKSAEGLIQFFMRGAFPFPSLTTKGRFVVFYNPVTDTGLITSWGGTLASPTITGAAFVSGEYLTESKISNKAPRWQLEEKMADKTVELSREVQRNAANAAPDFVALMTGALEQPAKSDALKIVLSRIAMAGIGTSDDALPCGKEITRVAASTSSLRDAATSTNIPKDSDNRLVFPVSGDIRGFFSLRVYALQNAPSDFIWVVADKSQKCEIFGADGVNTLKGLGD